MGGRCRRSAAATPAARVAAEGTSWVYAAAGALGAPTAAAAAATANPPAAFRWLGGSFRSACPSSLFHPGAFAHERLAGVRAAAAAAAAARCVMGEGLVCRRGPRCMPRRVRRRLWTPSGGGAAATAVGWARRRAAAAAGADSHCAGCRCGRGMAASLRITSRPPSLPRGGGCGSGAARWSSCRTATAARACRGGWCSGPPPGGRGRRCARTGGFGRTTCGCRGGRWPPLSPTIPRGLLRRHDAG